MTRFQAVTRARPDALDPVRPGVGFWFPGAWLGGFSLTVAPLVLLAATLLRAPFNYYFPHQLAAFDQHPRLMVTAYSLFVAGTVLLWPGVATLSRLIGQRRPGWAIWGAALVTIGLFTRAFHGGIDHLASQLVALRGPVAATELVDRSYSAWHIARFPAIAILTGWVVLAVGAYLSRSLGLIRSVCLAATCALALGTLKGTEPQSFVAVGGLCIALVPLGIAVLRAGPQPSHRALLGLVAAAVTLTLMIFFAPTG